MITKDEYLKIQRAVLELDEFKANTHENFDNSKYDDREFLHYHLIDNKLEFKEIYVMSYYYGFSEVDRTFFKWNGEKLIETTDEEDEMLREYDNEIYFFEQKGVYHLLEIDNSGTTLSKFEECLK